MYPTLKHEVYILTRGESWIWACQISIRNAEEMMNGSSHKKLLLTLLRHPAAFVSVALCLHHGPTSFSGPRASGCRATCDLSDELPIRMALGVYEGSIIVCRHYSGEQ